MSIVLPISDVEGMLARNDKVPIVRQRAGS
jgi:hypothetical protein